MKMQAKAVAIAICSLIGLPASAQILCTDTDLAMLQTIDRAFGATQQSVMISDAGALVRVFANIETGLWVIVERVPGRGSCAIVAGKNYEATPTAPQGEAG